MTLSYFLNKNMDRLFCKGLQEYSLEVLRQLFFPHLGLLDVDQLAGVLEPGPELVLALELARPGQHRLLQPAGQYFRPSKLLHLNRVGPGRLPAAQRAADELLGWLGVRRAAQGGTAVDRLAGGVALLPI